MSQQLDVKITKPIKLTVLRSQIEDALARLTASLQIPRVLAGTFEAGQIMELLGTETLRAREYYVFSCEHTPNSHVGVTVLELEPVPGYISESESGPVAGISVYAGGPEAFTLAAAIALALSELNDTAIEDDVCFWSKDLTTDPASFLKYLAVQANGHSFTEACQLLYRGLPKAVETPRIGCVAPARDTKNHGQRWDGIPDRSEPSASDHYSERPATECRAAVHRVCLAAFSGIILQFNGPQQGGRGARVWCGAVCSCTERCGGSVGGVSGGCGVEGGPAAWVCRRAFLSTPAAPECIVLPQWNGDQIF